MKQRSLQLWLMADLAGVAAPNTDGLSLAPILLGKPDEQETHRYLYWENGMISRHAQSVRMDQWWAYREHPSKPIALHDLSKDIACKNDLASDNPEVIKRTRQIFAEAHTNSAWYVNPGESEKQIAAKRKKAVASKSMQRGVTANTADKRRGEQIQGAATPK